MRFVLGCQKILSNHRPARFSKGIPKKHTFEGPNPAAVAQANGRGDPRQRQGVQPGRDGQQAGVERDEQPRHVEPARSRRRAWTPRCPEWTPLDMFTAAGNPLISGRLDTLDTLDAPILYIFFEPSPSPCPSPPCPRTPLHAFLLALFLFFHDIEASKVSKVSSLAFFWGHRADSRCPKASTRRPIRAATRARAARSAAIRPSPSTSSRPGHEIRHRLPAKIRGNAVSLLAGFIRGVSPDEASEGLENNEMPPASPGKKEAGKDPLAFICRGERRDADGEAPPERIFRRPDAEPEGQRRQLMATGQRQCGDPEQGRDTMIVACLSG
jgi:hypothetical protein